MKGLRFCLLTALLGSTSVFAAPLPSKMFGSYQALLFSGSDDTGSPSGLVSLTVSNKGAVSGKLTNEDNKTYSFKTTLDYIESAEPAEGEPIGTALSTPTKVTISRGKLTPLTIEIKLEDFDVEEEATLFVDVQDEGSTTGQTKNGFKVKTYAKGEAVPTLGSYTMAFELAAEPDEDEPEGSGYAVGKIDAKGILKVTGKTGDGTAFTASLPNGSANQFVMFVNPYKRPNSFLAGKIALTERSDDLFHMRPNDEEDGYDFQWKKAGLEKDKSYPDGYGPLDVIASIEPWAPAAKQTVADYFALGADEVFELAMSIPFASAYLPTSMTFTSKNTIAVTSGGAGSPSLLFGSGWSKIFTGKVDPKTGKVTATLNLSDEVGGKTVKRKVVIEGVMLKLLDGDDSPLFQGFTLVPSLTKGQPTVSGMMSLPDIILNPQIELNGATAGTYTGNYSVQLSTYTPGGTGRPANGSSVTFSVSPDLKTVVFAGRTLTLSGDSRPVALSYQDLKGSPKLVLTLRLNFSGNVTSYEGIYTTGRSNEIFTSGPTTKQP